MYAVVFIIFAVLGSAISVMAQSAPGEKVTPIIHVGAGEQTVDKLCIGSACGSSAFVEILGGQTLRVAGVYTALGSLDLPTGQININGGGTSDAINVGGGVYLERFENGIQDNLCVDSSGIIDRC